MVPPGCDASPACPLTAGQARTPRRGPGGRWKNFIRILLMAISMTQVDPLLRHLMTGEDYEVARQINQLLEWFVAFVASEHSYLTLTYTTED